MKNLIYSLASIIALSASVSFASTGSEACKQAIAQSAASKWAPEALAYQLPEARCSVQPGDIHDLSRPDRWVETYSVYVECEADRLPFGASFTVLAKTDANGECVVIRVTQSKAPVEALH